MTEKNLRLKRKYLRQKEIKRVNKNPQLKTDGHCSEKTEANTCKVDM